jgi:hypothetical protein
MQLGLGNKLNDAQINLIKSFRFLRNEQELKEIDSLINFYLEKKLDDAIEKVESEQNYTASIYEAWLKNDSAKK